MPPVHSDICDRAHFPSENVRDTLEFQGTKRIFIAKMRSIQQNEHTIPETASARVQTGNEDIRYKERHVLLGELS